MLDIELEFVDLITAETVHSPFQLFQGQDTPPRLIQIIAPVQKFRPVGDCGTPDHTAALLHHLAECLYGIEHSRVIPAGKPDSGLLHEKRIFLRGKRCVPYKENIPFRRLPRRDCGSHTAEIPDTLF